MTRGGCTPPPPRDRIIWPDPERVEEVGRYFQFVDPAEAARQRRDEIALRILLLQIEADADLDLNFGPTQDKLVEASYGLADKMLARTGEGRDA